MKRHTVRARRLVLESLESRSMYAVDFTPLIQPLDERTINGYQDLVIMDSNSDGKRDDLFFWTPGSGDNRLMEGGVITRQQPSQGIFSGYLSNLYTVAVNGDFDADGRQDDLFFWRPGDGDNRTMFNQGTYWDTLSNEPDKKATNGSFQNLVAGDFDGDNQVDDLFFWDRTSGSNRTLLGNGRGRWEVLSNTIVTGQINGYEKITVGDFDQDGKQDDIMVWKSNGDNRTFFGKSTGRAYDLLSNPIAAATTNGYSEFLAGDFDSDGRNDDLMFRNVASGESRLLLGNGSGRFLTVDRPVTATTINGYGRSFVGDFDCDGKHDDLFYWTNGGGSNGAMIGQWYDELPGVSWSNNELTVSGTILDNRIELTALERGFQVKGVTATIR